jgi:ABC-type nitrate/sulfonate/bicarbonate transport system permease component
VRRVALLGTTILLLFWVLVTSTGLIRPLFLPSPPAVFKRLGELVLSGEIVLDLWQTLWRTLAGFLLGSVLGIAAGLVMGYYRAIYGLLELPVDFFRSIPATALFPLFIVMFGLGDEVKVFIAAWSSSMVVLINTIYGIRSVSQVRLMVATLRRASFARRFYAVVIPSALPYIFAGLRIALSLALVVQIVAEMFLGSNGGLGHRIFNASSMFDMETAYAAVVVVGALGFTLNKAVLMAEARVIHWSGR